MSKFDKLHKAIADGKTLLGVGPMSWNCIDVVVDAANEYKIPMQLIASRRQVECNTLGGGYVTDTKTLADYVKNRDKGEYIFLARDHGGPWQGTDEADLSHQKAMEKALISYDTDIQCGFDILHIDPAIKPRPLDLVLKDIESIYHFCRTGAALYEKDIIYEAGTEEHSGNTTDIHNFKIFAQRVKMLKGMHFVVGNMGLFVKELENVGKFDPDQAEKLVSICDAEGLYLKGHNTDYCGFDVLDKKLKLGVHSINVAPEFGVAETKAVMSQLDKNDRNKFIQIALASKKWQKWMIKGKYNTHSPADAYCAEICGHYVFNHPAVIELRKNVDEEAVKKRLKKLLINDYLWPLGWEV